MDAIVRGKFDDPRVQIIDEHNRVHMARMDIHFSTSVNGVAKLHTEILKTSELKPFYDLYPERFNNKTNGISFRRWLEFANQELADYIKELIGDDYLTDATQLEKLAAFADDPAVHKRLSQIKYDNKLALKRYLKANKGIDLDENSIIDTQVKRFHEYKTSTNECFVCHPQILRNQKRKTFQNVKSQSSLVVKQLLPMLLLKISFT